MKTIISVSFLLGLAVAGCSSENSDTSDGSNNQQSPASQIDVNDRVDPTVLNSAEGQKDAASNLVTVPTRFRGLFAIDEKACAQDYSYGPAFQNVTVSARSVSFFETGGPVTDVNIEGDMAAITIRETVGDSETTRAIYLAINPDGVVRYRAGDSEQSKDYVRCER